MDRALSKTLLSPLCKLLGHNWRYDDYSDCINEDGEEYGIDTYRKCSRCKQQEYFLLEWSNEKEFSHQIYHQMNDY